MTTKELIKQLQEADPTGECHVRISGEPVVAAYSLPGYWDGPYNYIENGEDGKPVWVQSTEGDKVDISTVDLFWLAEHYKGDWEEMKKHIRVDYNYLDDGEREREFLKLAKEECIEYKRIDDELYNQGLEEMSENAKKGWKWYQNKDVDKNEKPNMHFYYTWKIYDEKGKEQGSNVHMTECVMKSGNWVKLDNKKKKGYYEWVYRL